tara:strand:- start:60955 stop:61194 length:240 start_codon:yes stop_codon:yes gene_type:complete
VDAGSIPVRRTNFKKWMRERSGRRTGLLTQQISNLIAGSNPVASTKKKWPDYKRKTFDEKKAEISKIKDLLIPPFAPTF